VQADQTEAALRATGLNVTRADNICFAEMFAEAQRFEAAVCDHSLSQEEQVSLARVMRIRWPWMRIIRWVSSGDPLQDDALFDCSVFSRSQLASCVEHALG
jgi:DNA-binding NtrC family response regulator